MSSSQASQMQVVLLSDGDSQRWDSFVHSHPDATNFHQWGWKVVIERTFEWPCYYLAAVDGDQVRGILPIVWQKSVLFGSYMTSLPFLNAGGVVTDSESTGTMLIEAGIQLAKEKSVQYLELRHRSDKHLSMVTKTNKVVVIKEVQSDADAMFKALDKKVRADVRKSEKSGFVCEFGGKELIEDFYRVFAVNMRDLGTPVYTKKLFENIFEVFPDRTYICRIRLGTETVAASFLTGYRDSVEVSWSSSLRKYLQLKPNMFLYWNLLSFAGRQGYTIFDFGRSTVGAGTHKFKLQWGVKEIPLYWNYWLRDGGELPEKNPNNPKYKLALSAWQMLPVVVTRLIGPKIVRCLP